MNQARVAYRFSQLMKEGLGLDLSDPNLLDTPERIAKMYCTEWFSNIETDFDDFKSFPNKKKYKQIILFDNIEFTSYCAHHFLPFKGLAFILYIPNKTFIGTSKPTRLVEHYAARPQLQEDLTMDILNRFVKKIRPEGAMVVIRCTHQCMMCRGVKQRKAGLTTDALHGAFFQQEMELKGLELIKIAMALAD